jgi:hypothetical protein
LNSHARAAFKARLAGFILCRADFSPLFQRWNFNGCLNLLPCRDNAVQGGNMKRLLLLGFAICAFAFGPTLPASAMPVAKQQPVVANSDSDVVQVRGHRGGRGHHYGWGRGRHRGDR